MRRHPRSMRIFARSLFVRCLVAMGAAFAGPAHAAPELLDRIVAVVDDQVILWSELNFRLLMDFEQEGRTFRPDESQINERRARLLEDMIDERVLVIKARRDSIVVDASVIDERLNEQMRRIHARLSPEEFEQMLERSGLSERQLKARYRKDIRNELLSSQLRSQLAYRQHVTHRDVETFRESYDGVLPPRVFLSQINIKPKPEQTVLSQASGKIEAVRQKLEAGLDFAEAARQYSEDPGTADAGGDLGCFGPGTLLPEVEQAAAVLKPGETSEPVLTALGYHIIRLDQRLEGELCASHVLARAPVTPGDKERARQLLVELRGRALAGEDFAQLAQEYSDDPQTAKQGGLWQSFSKDEIPPFLKRYVDRLSLGGVSEPFFLDDGGHILKVNDDQATIENILREERMQDTVSLIIAEFRTQIHIDNRLSGEYVWQDTGDAP